jgi:ABC-type Mn2+/Zn2+ transport system ATPase subunit
MSQHETSYGASGIDGSGSEDDYQVRTATKVAAGYAGAYGGGRGGPPVVTFENVSKHYGRLRAVDGLSLELRAGETVALLGPNGAGKSTSLDMLLALRKPTSGRIRMFGDDPYHGVKSGRVGAMLQSGGLMPEVTVRDLVELVTKLHPNPEPVQTTLKRAGITQFADQRVDRLSGGQTQRVRFALAICGKSELIVLDEPTAAMDVETRRLFWNSMKEEVAAGRTLLFATHYLEEADQAADRILVINWPASGSSTPTWPPPRSPTGSTRSPRASATYSRLPRTDGPSPRSPPSSTSPRARCGITCPRASRRPAPGTAPRPFASLPSAAGSKPSRP